MLKQMPGLNDTVLLLIPRTQNHAPQIVQVSLESERPVDVDVIGAFFIAQKEIEAFMQKIVQVHLTYPVPTPVVFKGEGYFLHACTKEWKYGKKWVFMWGDEVIEPCVDNAVIDTPKLAKAAKAVHQQITHFGINDVRFPTSLTGDGSDAMNTECDYSSAYISLFTSSDLVGHGMTFTIGRGNDIVCMAIKEVATRLIGRDIEELFADMGKTWDYLLADAQLRWIGPEKGVIHIASGAVDNALWDLFAKSRKKPLWKLIVDMTPEEFIRSTAFRYITDALTREEALEMLKAKAVGKTEREAKVRKIGYPAYVTSAGWLGYDDEKITRLTLQALRAGFNHFKMKVGTNLADDLRRGKIIRSVIDNPANLPVNHTPPEPGSLYGKNAGPTGAVLMIDANQVWDVSQAIEYVKGLQEIRPWFIEEPTAPDDVLGHSAIRQALKPYGIGVATGEHGHNRILFKQLFQAEAIDVCQIDSCRLAGVSEVLAVLLMAAKFGIPVCPHAGGVGLCEYVIHLSLIDYIAVSGTMERNVLEYVDHLHEHFINPCSINSNGRYNVPTKEDEGYSIEMHKASIAEYEWPSGRYWKSTKEQK